MRSASNVRQWASESLEQETLKHDLVDLSRHVE
jgi:hypothetical protein